MVRQILQAECDRRRQARAFPCACPKGYRSAYRRRGVARQNPDSLGDDILSLLLTAKDEDGQSMSDREIQDELLTMLFAGHETTASSLAWCFYLK